VINLLSLIELASPSGICVIIRLPFLGGLGGAGNDLFKQIRAAGGTVETLNF
jgi:hypothetical protein